MSIARKFPALLLAAAVLLGGVTAAFAADPIRVGLSMSLTGGLAPNGKQELTALEIWRDDVNAKGGLLGRPVALVYYDDQSNPGNAPSIYTKLIEVDKVELIIGPYATNIIAAALPVIMQHNMTTISIQGMSANAPYHYPGYFSMLSTGPDPGLGISQGFFDLAMAQNPKPKTIAIVAADAEYSLSVSEGARRSAKAAGLQLVYDKTYPPSTTDFAPILRAVQALNPDIVYVASYPPDTVGIVRAAKEIGLKTKIFGGAMNGLLSTPIKMQLGPLINGIVNAQGFPAPVFDTPEVRALLAKYQARAAELKIDPLGYNMTPFAYAAGQTMAQAVAGTQSLDPTKLADYIRGHDFDTVVGKITFGKDGEWAISRMFVTQFQGVAGNDLEEFRGMKHEIVLWPPEYKKGDLVYPYAE